MKLTTRKMWATLTVVGVIVLVCFAYAQQEQREQTSYMPVGIKEPFAAIMARMTKAKPAKLTPQEKQDLVAFMRTL
jgi:hypothetical protein